MSRRSDDGEMMVAEWKWAFGPVAVAILGCASLGGCSETLPLANLPDIAKLPGKVLSKDEQQKAMNQMIEKGQTHQADAIKQIEKGK
jgi:hypothetical protein